MTNYIMAFINFEVEHNLFLFFKNLFHLKYFYRLHMFSFVSSIVIFIEFVDPKKK